MKGREKTRRVANLAYMNHHLRFISEQAGPAVHMILVLDRAGQHLSKALPVPENITLLHLPPYSQELNPVERLRNQSLPLVVKERPRARPRVGRPGWPEIRLRVVIIVCTMDIVSQ